MSLIPDGPKDFLDEGEDIVVLPCYRETISYENGEYWIRFEVKPGPYDPWREWIPPFEEDAPLPHFIIQWVRYLDDPPRP